MDLMILSLSIKVFEVEFEFSSSAPPPPLYPFLSFLRHIIFITSYLCLCHANILLASTEHNNNKNKLLHFSYHFSLFLTVSLLSVVLWPEEGDFHENLHRVVYVIINKRSFESFMCFYLVFFSNIILYLVFFSNIILYLFCIERLKALIETHLRSLRELRHIVYT